jgi:cytochrome c5
MRPNFFCLLGLPTGNSTGMKKLAILSLVALSACGSGNDEEEEEELPPVVNCSAVQPIPAYSQVEVFQSVCTNCHNSSKVGAARNGAPADINFDQYASAYAHANQAAIEVNVGAMPPATAHITLTEVQKTTLFNWAMCGAPQ